MSGFVLSNISWTQDKIKSEGVSNSFLHLLSQYRCGVTHDVFVTHGTEA